MSYTFTQTGSEIQAILDRAEAGGQIDQEIAAKQDALTFDAVPTEGSTNPAESGGIYDAIQAGGATALAAFATDSVTPGDIVSFSDGADGIPVKSFVGSIVPIQDLHGQSAPYPAGGGKNLLNATMTGTYVTMSNGVYTVSSSPSTNNAFDIGTVHLVPGNYLINGGNSQAFGWYMNVDGTVYTSNSSSDVAVTVTTEGDYAVKGVVNAGTATGLKMYPMIRLASVSDPTFAPYSNICPISGWSRAEITRAGGNLLTGLENGSRLSDGEKTTSTVRVRSTNYMPVKAGDTVMVQASTSASKNLVVSCQAWASNTDSGNTRLYDSGWQSIPFVYTIPSGANYCTFVLRYDPESTISAAEITASVFAGDTITLTFGDTVYAGTITALGGGKWSIQPTHEIVDLGSLNYDYRSAKNAFDATVSGMVDGVAGTVADILCSTYPATASLTYSSWQTAPDKSIFVSSSESSRIVIRDTAYSSAAAFKTGVTGQTVLYPLATLHDPIIVSGDDLETILGANTVWTDVGAVTEMEYRADTALYIQKLLNGGGTLQTLSMASPSPSLSLSRVGVLAEPEEAEPEQTDEEAEQLEQTEEPEQTEEE